jgi:hypothetical protein
LHTASDKSGALPHSQETEASFLTSATFNLRETKPHSIIDNFHSKFPAPGLQMNAQGLSFCMSQDVGYGLLGDTKSGSLYSRVYVLQRLGRAKLCSQSRPASLLIE